MRNVIVGAGLAGVRAAEGMREAGFDGEILLIGAERELPYQRPALSKQFLRGELRREDLPLEPEEFFAAQRIELIAGERVEALSTTDRQLVLSSGNRLPYDGLLITTGAEPRRLTVPGADLGGVHYLRTVSDSEALRSGLEKAQRVVVIGGGLIGLEVAAVARGLGKIVTVLEAERTPLRRLLGNTWGHVVTDLHRDHSVDFRTGARIAFLRGHRQVEEVVLDDGSSLPADLVVVGIGVHASTDWLRDSGVELSDGVNVDAFGQTSVPGIYAAGDVASLWSEELQRRIRIEQFGNAQAHGKAVGRTMAGTATVHAARPAAGSEQFGVRLQVSGAIVDGLREVVRGSVGEHSFTVFFVDSRDVLRAAFSVARPKDAMVTRKLIAAGARVSLTSLGDEACDLSQVAIAAP